MFMNYMDYVDDRAMVMFTAGQVARMQACLDGVRSAIGVGAAAARRPPELFAGASRGGRTASIPSCSAPTARCTTNGATARPGRRR